MANLNEASLYVTVAVAIANLKRLKQKEQRKEAILDIIETLVSVYRNEEGFKERVVAMVK